MASDYIVRPIQQWPGKQTSSRKRAPFRSTYVRTHLLLNRELVNLGARGVVLQMAVNEGDIRVDGQIRANCRPMHPGVILIFDSRKGPLSFPCDTFDEWLDNLRAIALAMEALRKVDRYGVTQQGQQYRGFKPLPAPTSLGFGSVCDAKMFVAELLERNVTIHTREDWEKWLREAEMKTHPDRGGDPEAFKRVQTARQLILAA